MLLTGLHKPFNKSSDENLRHESSCKPQQKYSRYLTQKSYLQKFIFNGIKIQKGKTYISILHHPVIDFLQISWLSDLCSFTPHLVEEQCRGLVCLSLLKFASVWNLKFEFGKVQIEGEHCFFGKYIKLVALNANELLIQTKNTYISFLIFFNKLVHYI